MTALMTRGTASLEPTTLTEAMRFAEMLANSTMVPKDYIGKPANVLVAMQWGREVGLGPLQALSNISVINGRPSIWGDAALALVRGHPACNGVREGVEGDGDARHGWCEVTRRGEEPQRRTFSVADAKKAGLWGKQGPWQQYPDRMLQLRARGFALRDVFPDALRGVITTEEAQDMPGEPREVPNLAPIATPAVEISAPKQATEPELPIIAPDGRMVPVRVSRWLDAVKRAVGRMENPEALSLWRAEMGALLGSIYEQHPDLVAEAEAVIDSRREEMLEPAE